MLETASDVAKAMVHMHAANVLHSGECEGGGEMAGGGGRDGERGARA